MIIKSRVLEARLAARISNNPDLAKEFGFKMSTNNDRSEEVNLDKRISFQTSTEAYE